MYLSTLTERLRDKCIAFICLWTAALLASLVIQLSGPYVTLAVSFILCFGFAPGVVYLASAEKRIWESDWQSLGVAFIISVLIMGTILVPLVVTRGLLPIWSIALVILVDLLYILIPLIRAK